MYKICKIESAISQWTFRINKSEAKENKTTKTLHIPMQSLQLNKSCKYGYHFVEFEINFTFHDHFVAGH